MKHTMLLLLALPVLLSCNNNSSSSTPAADSTGNTGSDTATHAATGSLAMHVRKNIYSLPATGTEITALRAGVAAMKTRQASDPTSWSYQAAIHGSYDSHVKPAWNTCQHGSFFFLSWHRMYLYYFEKILRKASGDSSFALPYWNYSDDNTQRALPVVFRQPADNSNSLYEPLRDPDINSGGLLSPSTVSYQAAFSETLFNGTSDFDPGFGGITVAAPAHFNNPHGLLENQPHDQVHVAIGGDNGLMSDPNTAAEDPIFWLHHCNIDRLWTRWLARAGGRVNPTGNGPWMNQVFTFYDENGHAVHLTGSQVINTAAQLSYVYDDSASQVTQNISIAQDTSRKKLQKMDFLKKTNITTKGMRTDLPMGSSKQVKLDKFITQSTRPATGKPRERIILTLGGITYDSIPRGVFEVYINLPAEGQPEYNSNHYAGNIGLFGFMAHHGGQEMHMGGTVVLDITSTIRKLNIDNINLDSIHVSIVHKEAVTSASGKTGNIKGEIKIKSVTISGLK